MKTKRTEGLRATERQRLKKISNLHKARDLKQQVRPRLKINRVAEEKEISSSQGSTKSKGKQIGRN